MLLSGYEFVEVQKMKPIFRTWLIRIMLALIVCAFVSLFFLMTLAVMNGDGALPVVINPTGKGGSAFPIQIVVFFFIVILIVGYGAIVRLLGHYRAHKSSRRRYRRGTHN